MNFRPTNPPGHGPCASEIPHEDPNFADQASEQAWLKMAILTNEKMRISL